MGAYIIAPMTALTPDQVVAYNLRRARELHGWTQEEAAERLEPFLGERWSRVVFSAAERSVASNRVRQFSASQLVALAAGFDLPVAFFLMPPHTVTSIAARGAKQSLTSEELIELAITPERERVQDLVDDRFAEILRLASRDAPQGSPKAMAEQQAARDARRQGDRELATALHRGMQKQKEQPK
jgi:transcriptional regulator with XRE-family HTH domain